LFPPQLPPDFDSKLIHIGDSLKTIHLQIHIWNDCHLCPCVCHYGAVLYAL